MANDTGTSQRASHGKREAGSWIRRGVIPECLNSGHIRLHCHVKTDAAGRYRCWSDSGDYLLFAVPRGADFEYFALDFADRNLDKAESVSLDSRESQVINLKPTKVR